MEFTKLILTAILVEAIWENCKMIWQEGKFNVNMVGSLILGILICVFSGLDLFMITGINLNLPVLGCVFTGIIIARGANFVNDLFAKLQQ